MGRKFLIPKQENINQLNLFAAVFGKILVLNFGILQEKVVSNVLLLQKWQLNY